MLESLQLALILLIAVEHVWILYLEMFLWKTPQGLKAFNLTPEQAESTAVLAGNQGLYNGFLAAGLLWSIWSSEPALAVPLRLFFLGCVSVAGLYGGYSVNKRIFFLQGLPAMLTLALVLFADHLAKSPITLEQLP